MLNLDRPKVLGVLNITPNSFSDAGSFLCPKDAITRAEQMISEGVDVIDLGAESTKPGAKPVTVSEQISRLTPVLSQLSTLSDTPVSIDTSEAEVFQAAFDLGATIWNDTRALSLPGAAKLAANLKVTSIVMHRRGEDHAEARYLSYQNVTGEVIGQLKNQLLWLESEGVDRSRVIVDPGFGFSKDAISNFQLLSQLEDLGQLECPIMVGVSKKRMLGFALTNADLPDNLDDRVEVGLSCAVIAVAKGAKLIRTHDVAATKRALSVFELQGVSFT